MVLCKSDRNSVGTGANAPGGGSGFSLVELLVVLGFIGLLFAFAAPSLLTNRTIDLSGAALEVSAFFEEARSEAVAFGVPVRILIHDERSEPGRFMRRVIAVREVDGDFAESRWEQILSPVLLPEGIYFDFSRPGTSSRRIRFAEGAAPEISWRSYEIRGSGTPGGEARNVILGAGVLNTEDAQPRFPNSAQMAGFRITNATRMIPYHSGAEILSTPL